MEHRWFTSYLSSRFQYVESSGIKSNLSLLTEGIPQGLILGPLIFLLYINDLTSVLSDLHFTLFADDPTVMTADKSFLLTIQLATDHL